MNVYSPSPLITAHHSSRKRLLPSHSTRFHAPGRRPAGAQISPAGAPFFFLAGPGQRSKCPRQALGYSMGRGQGVGCVLYWAKHWHGARRASDVVCVQRPRLMASLQPRNGLSALLDDELDTLSRRSNSKCPFGVCGFASLCAPACHGRGLRGRAGSGHRRQRPAPNDLGGVGETSPPVSPVQGG